MTLSANVVRRDQVRRDLQEDGVEREAPPLPAGREIHAHQGGARALLSLVRRELRCRAQIASPFTRNL